MLYIEDFLELIEPFPQELRERLTEMREIDLKIQNETDKLDGRIDTFFQGCKKQKSEWKLDNYEEIKKEYSKLLENADDKIQIANQLADLIEKYLKKLDQELQKFKLELEADHAGITSKLEQVISSKNMNEPTLHNINMSSALSSSFTANLQNLNSNNDESDFTLCSSSNDLIQMMMLQNHQFNNNDTNNNTPVTNLHSNHKRKHSNFSEKSTNLIPNQMSTNLLNDEDSSSSWNSSNLNNTIFNLNRKSSLTLSANKRHMSTSSSRQTSLESNLLNLINTSIPEKKRHIPAGAALLTKNKRTKLDTKPRGLIKKPRINDLDFDDETYEDDENARNEFYNSDDNNNETGDETNEAASEVTSSENGVSNANNDEQEDYLASSDEDQVSEDFEHHRSKLSKVTSKKTRNQYSNSHRQFKDDWNSGDDTSERYCICKDVSYGDMIMCDNTRCDTQWFHFVCVGLNSAPKGKWFCPSCAEIKKKRKEKHLNAILQANSLSSSNAGLTTTSSQSIQSNTSSSLSMINQSNDLINQYVVSSSNST